MRKLSFLAGLAAVLLLGSSSVCSASTPIIDLGGTANAGLGAGSTKVDLTGSGPDYTLAGAGVVAGDTVVSIGSSKVFAAGDTITIASLGTTTGMTVLSIGGRGGSAVATAQTGFTSGKEFQLVIGGDFGSATFLGVTSGLTARDVEFTGKVTMKGSAQVVGSAGGNRLAFAEIVEAADTAALALSSTATTGRSVLVIDKITRSQAPANAGGLEFTVLSTHEAGASIVYGGVAKNELVLGGVADEEDKIIFTNAGTAAGRAVFETTGTLTLNNILAAATTSGKTTLTDAGEGIIRTGGKLTMNIAGDTSSTALALGQIENTAGGVILENKATTKGQVTFVGTAATASTAGTGISATAIDFVGNGTAAAGTTTSFAAAGAATITAGAYTAGTEAAAGQKAVSESWAGDGIITLKNNVTLAGADAAGGLTINAAEVRVVDALGATIKAGGTGDTKALTINADVVVGARDDAGNLYLDDVHEAKATIGDGANDYTFVNGVSHQGAGTTTLAGTNLTARGLVSAAGGTGEAFIVAAEGQKFETGFDIGTNATLKTAADDATLTLGRTANGDAPAQNGVLTLRDGGMLQANAGGAGDDLTLAVATGTTGLIRTVNTAGDADGTARVIGAVTAEDFNADLSGGLFLNDATNDKLSVKNVTQNGGEVFGDGELTASGNYALNGGELTVGKAAIDGTFSSTGGLIDVAALTTGTAFKVNAGTDWVISPAHTAKGNVTVASGATARTDAAAEIDFSQAPAANPKPLFTVESGGTLDLSKANLTVKNGAGSFVDGKVVFGGTSAAVTSLTGQDAAGQQQVRLGGNSVLSLSQGLQTSLAEAASGETGGILGGLSDKANFANNVLVSSVNGATRDDRIGMFSNVVASGQEVVADSGNLAYRLSSLFGDFYVQERLGDVNTTRVIALDRVDYKDYKDPIKNREQLEKNGFAGGAASDGLIANLNQNAIGMKDDPTKRILVDNFENIWPNSPAGVPSRSRL